MSKVFAASTPRQSGWLILGGHCTFGATAARSIFSHDARQVGSERNAEPSPVSSVYRVVACGGRTARRGVVAAQPSPLWEDLCRAWWPQVGEVSSLQLSVCQSVGQHRTSTQR